MQFVTSLTIEASLLKRLLKLWDEGGDKRNPFKAILVTPLFASSTTLRIIRDELKEKRGSLVYFDSGGYYTQQGKLTFDNLYRVLRDYYKNPNNQWADWYVLPDHVPTSSDTTEIVEEKVHNTITAAKMFFNEAPSKIQPNCIPVIQGHNIRQVNDCISTYSQLGIKYIGFGSFGTNGLNSSINVTDKRSASIVQHIVQEFCNGDVRIHTFGVSTPPVIYAFQKIGVYSFDSLAWQRSAGFGKVYMPFTRAYNVSHRSTRNAAFTELEFNYLKKVTGHDCPFCENFRLLSNNRLYRSLHNLISILDTINPQNPLKQEDICFLIEWKSKHYFDLFKDIYLG